MSLALASVFFSLVIFASALVARLALTISVVTIGLAPLLVALFARRSVAAALSAAALHLFACLSAWLFAAVMIVPSPCRSARVALVVCIRDTR